MQDTDTVHYIVAVKRKADEMDVKDKEMRRVLIKNSIISERAAVLKR